MKRLLIIAEIPEKKGNYECELRVDGELIKVPVSLVLDL